MSGPFDEVIVRPPRFRQTDTMLAGCERAQAVEKLLGLSLADLGRLIRAAEEAEKIKKTEEIESRKRRAAEIKAELEADPLLRAAFYIDDGDLF